MEDARSRVSRKSVETRPPEQEQSWRRSNDHRRTPETTCVSTGQAFGSQLLEGTYQPQPVKRVEIPKPDGGVRKLGVPCVVDRLIQQAVLQVLQERWDPTFSEHSYGFRPESSI